MNKYLEELKNKTDVRRSLIAIKEAIRDGNEKRNLALALEGDFSLFASLLKYEDPKVRKNAVLILGIMEAETFLQEIWDAYQTEETLFVKADYVKALAHFDCTPYVKEMKARVEELDRIQQESEEVQKHAVSELNALKMLLIKTERPKKHEFINMRQKMEVILMTNRNQREITAAQIPEKNLRLLAGGIRFVTTHLEEILPIRTYSELLFPIPELQMISGSPEHMAEQLVGSSLMRFLEEHHTGCAPFYFRLDIKTSMPQERRVDLLKKLSTAMERLSGRTLLNAPSGYEMELRLVANKEGQFVPLLKLFTIHDRRFAYRKETLPTSISPVNAAIVMRIAGDYLQEGAQVLDPFCGTGTMLIERRMYGKTGSVYGVDILEDAIEKARVNTGIISAKVNYINRDFFDFQHEYLFDEIITNLPGCSRSHGTEEITQLYNRFLDRILHLTKEKATCVVYTSELGLLKACLRNRLEFKKCKEALLNERDGSGVIVFCRRS